MTSSIIAIPLFSSLPRAGDDVCLLFGHKTHRRMNTKNIYTAGTSTNILYTNGNIMAQQMQRENPPAIQRRARQLLLVFDFYCDNLLIFFPQPSPVQPPHAGDASTFTENNHLASQIGLNSLGSTSGLLDIDNMPFLYLCVNGNSTKRRISTMRSATNGCHGTTFFDCFFFVSEILLFVFICFIFSQAGFKRCLLVERANCHPISNPRCQELLQRSEGEP